MCGIVAVWNRDGRPLKRVALYDTLSAPATRRTGIFEPDAVADVLAYFEREPHFHTAHMVFTLLCFPVWCDRRTRA